MSTIPFCYSSPSESFITIPVLKRFLRGIDESTSYDRKELIDKLEEYAAASIEHKQEVLDWLDIVLKEGILELYVCPYELDDLSQIKLKDPRLMQRVESNLMSPDNRHICGNSYCGEYRLVDCSSRTGEHGEVLCFTMCKLVFVSNQRGSSYTLIYPVFFDIYKEINLLTIRVKSKANLYIYSNDGFSIENAQTTNADREAKNAKEALEKLLGIKLPLEDDGILMLRSKLYKLLEKYTQTPNEIKVMMDSKKMQIKELSENLISDICALTPQYTSDVQSDINNLVEKYFSISYPDKTIFTKNRAAYPLKIIATDDEDSKVEQTAALEEPLQSKAVFFDNKKMMQKSGVCDGIWFRYLRVDTKYFGRQFNIRMQARMNRFVIKFTEFTMEEDIMHVLFSLISTRADFAVRTGSTIF